MIWEKSLQRNMSFNSALGVSCLKLELYTPLTLSGE